MMNNMAESAAAPACRSGAPTTPSEGDFRMKLTIDPAICTGHGRCYTLAPGLLSYDDEGFPNERGTTIDVPHDQEDAARQATASCPEGAITING
jgi:ferredoxin